MTVSVEPAELIGQTRDEIREFLASLDEKPFRAQQLYDAIYRRRISSFDAMTDLPKTLRRILADHAVITHTRVQSRFLSSDGTQRFLLKLADGSEVELAHVPCS